MDENGESRRHRIDYYKVPPWNEIPQYQMEEPNVYHINAKINMLYVERDAAIEERDRALTEKKAALHERDAAVQQRDAAFLERDNALRERDNAIAALRFQENTLQALLNSNSTRGLKRKNHPTSVAIQSAQSFGEGFIADAVPISTFTSEASKSNQATKKKLNKDVLPIATKSPKKVKRLNEDLNRRVTTDGSRAEWEAQNFGSMEQLQFDDSTMPVPVCSCTGVPHQCYKWGNGGWQSSCCTTSLSEYPLPQMTNKKHGRMGGRKMSGSVFSRLLTRLSAEGHDLSTPLDLKNYWAKHGTNRYITIK